MPDETETQRDARMVAGLQASRELMGRLGNDPEIIDILKRDFRERGDEPPKAMSREEFLRRVGLTATGDQTESATPGQDGSA